MRFVNGSAVVGSENDDGIIEDPGVGKCLFYLSDETVQFVEFVEVRF